jgi:glycosyltransferase involved in cell wall biosynthesis
VTIPRDPLTQIVRHGQEGLHFTEGDADSLAQAIMRLAEDPPLRRVLGQNARDRVVAHYSWARHCAALETVLERIVA